MAAKPKARPQVQVHLKGKRRPPVLIPAKGIEVAKKMGVTDLALAELMQYKARSGKLFFKFGGPWASACFGVLVW